METTAAPGHSESLAGQTIRWQFNEGPTAGKIYEHTFRCDGTVVWREVSPGAKNDQKQNVAGTRYASFEVAPATHMVSYLAESGYTLTVAINLDTKKCWAVASNEKEWYPLTGSLESPPRE